MRSVYGIISNPDTWHWLVICVLPSQWLIQQGNWSRSDRGGACQLELFGSFAHDQDFRVAIPTTIQSGPVGAAKHILYLYKNSTTAAIIDEMVVLCSYTA